MRPAWRAAELLALPTVGLCAALALAPDRFELEVRVALLVVLCLAALASLGVVRSAYPRTASPFAASLLRPDPTVVRPAALARLEREVSMARSSAFDVHHRLRPALLELAAGLLSSRRGIDLAREPERAHLALGDDAWELVRPDRPPPAQRLGPGIEAAHLDRIVSALERI
jgi:hypothetical protein